MSVELYKVTKLRSEKTIWALTRTVVTAFGTETRQSGARADTQLEPYAGAEKFVTELSAAFPAQVAERGAKNTKFLVSHFGPGVMRSVIMEGLRAETPAVIDTVTTHIGELAGGEATVAAMASRVGEDLKGTNPNEAAPLFLTMLSTQAMQHSAELLQPAA